MRPVSSSSSLLRQQRPQPSHRLSHSVGVISARLLRRQKGTSGSRLAGGGLSGMACSKLNFTRFAAISHRCRPPQPVWTPIGAGCDPKIIVQPIDSTCDKLEREGRKPTPSVPGSCPSAILRRARTAVGHYLFFPFRYRVRSLACPFRWFKG